MKKGKKLSVETKAKIKATKEKKKEERPNQVIIDIEGYKLTGDSFSYTLVSPTGKRSYFEYIESAMKHLLQQKIKLVNAYKIDDLIDAIEKSTENIVDVCKKFKVKQ